MSNAPAPTQIEELAGVEVQHCESPHSETSYGIFSDHRSLPYHDLQGAGLERLCFQLLVSRGYEPRFFGRSGQRQYGVDLVVAGDGRIDVYQCKNLAAPPRPSELRAYLNAFRTGWLEAAGLPKPKRFVICCPQLFRSSETDRDWILAKETFENDTGVEAILWHQDLMDLWLKQLPDIVADVFSGRHAEVFCNVEDWKPDLFIPVREGVSGDLRLKRYFEHRNSGRLYVDENHQQRLTDALENSPVIHLRGLPGTGKTLAGLVAAQTLHGGRWRVYFVDMGDHELTREQLKTGIRRRLSRSSLFVLENCHERAFDVERVLRDLSPELASGRVLIMCLSRRVPSPDISRSDESQYFQELASQGSTVDFELDDRLLTRFVEFLKPHFKGISGARVLRLRAVCGGDLLILDELLQALESPDEIDDIDASRMYERFHAVYFGNATVDKLLETRRLAALAQCGLRPRADIWSYDDREQQITQSLCVRAGRPPRLHFLHSTAAELALHTLWFGMGIRDPQEVADEAAKDIVYYFERAQTAALRPAATVEVLARNLIEVLTSWLSLTTRSGEKRLKAAVLDSDPVLMLLGALESSPEYLATVSWCAVVSQRVGAHRSREYAIRLRDALEKTLLGVDEDAVAAIPYLGLMLRRLARVAPDLHNDIAQDLPVRRLLDMLEVNGTILELFMIMERVPPRIGVDIVRALDDERLDRLVKRTIDTNASIGLLHRALRSSPVQEETSVVGSALAERVGPARLVRLIRANGTLRELFHIVSHTSPELARCILDGVDEDMIERLVQKTIASGRSIGTLDITLRQLCMSRETAPYGEALERLIGPVRFLRLIEANGSIVELFKRAERGSPEFVRGMLEVLDSDSGGSMLEKLIDKTIGAARSIGTLNLALRGLRLSTHKAALGEELERLVGSARILRLIEANGTLFELFGVIQHASATLAGEIVDALDEALIERLLRKTIAVGRSIGTLNFTFRELRMTGESEVLGREFERKIGPMRVLRLIEGNGTIPDLFLLIRDASPEMAAGMVEALGTPLVERLVQRTLRMGRSLGTLSLALRGLRKSMETADLAVRLERKIGLAHFLALLDGNGNLSDLFGLIQCSSHPFARQLVASVEGDRLEALVERSISSRRSLFGLCLKLSALNRGEKTSEVGNMLEQKVGPARFWRLVLGTGTAGALVQLVQAMSPPFSRTFLSGGAGVSQEQWEKVLSRGDFFQLCVLISEIGPMRLGEGDGGLRLLGAIAAEVGGLVARSNWYQRNTGLERLTKCRDSSVRKVTLRALDDWLASVPREDLRFSSLKEAVHGLELVLERRSSDGWWPDRGLRGVLPPLDAWTVNPKEDGEIPRRLLRLAARPEVSNDELEYVVRSLSATMPQMARVPTSELFLLAWALFNLRCQRPMGPGRLEWEQPILAEVREALSRRVAERADVDELRSRFALCGLMPYLGASLSDTAGMSLGRDLDHLSVGEAVRWLTASQPLVLACAVLRGIAIVRSIPGDRKRELLRHVLESRLPGSDGAGRLLVEEVRREFENAAGS